MAAKVVLNTTLPTCVNGSYRTASTDLCDKRAQFGQSYDHLDAHRTSNMVDWLMNFLDRAGLNGQYFHGTLASAESPAKIRYPVAPRKVNDIT
jgi:hypothetical protein